MQSLKTAVIALILLGGISAVWARTYYLPDYQSEFYSGSRTQSDDSGRHTSTPSCSDYGLYSARQTNADCTTRQPAPGLTCYSCTCNPKYKYTSSNCSGNNRPSGSSCMGRYNKCMCNTSKFPYTSSNCSYDLGGGSCSDSGGYHYKSCVNPCTAYSSYTNVSSCSYGCEKTVSVCPAKCSKCYTDNCRNRTSVSAPHGCEEYFDDCSSKCKKAYGNNCHNRTDNKTDLGCEKYWSDCPSKCQTGKTCVPNSCSGYTLTSCPTDSVCESCTKGCGDNTRHYKVTGCSISFPEGYGTSKTCPEAGQTLKSFTACDETRYKCVCEKAEQTCLPGTSLVNICTNDAGNEVGDCVDCRDPESPKNPCKGFALCEGDKVGDGETCDCGGLTYHERCLVPEKCLNGVKYDDTPLGSCSYGYPLSATFWWCNGRYPSGIKCSQQDGTKLYCHHYCNDTTKDQAGNIPPCAGKKECANNDGIGLCECGGKKYFDECNEKCQNGVKYDDTPLGSCSYGYSLSDTFWWSNGRYPSGIKCSQQDGTKLYCHHYCNDTTKDQAGNIPPCAGKKKCPSGNYALGELCTCGGITYGDSCGTVCNYEDTPERCAAQGKSFSRKCADSSGNLFGECI